MVIDGNNGLNGTSGSARNRTSSATSSELSAKGAKTPTTPQAGDNVSLSSEAQKLNRLEAQINASPEIDTARVARIKEAIANGSFEINAERIAEKMLNQDDLLG